MLPNYVLAAILAMVAAIGPLTNLQAGRLGINAGKTTSTQYSRIYIDYTRRSFGKFVVPGTATPVALDVNGKPIGNHEWTLTANPLANDLMVYNCWRHGQISGGGGGGQGIAKSSATTTTVVNFSSPVYTAGDNITRWTATVVSGGGILGFVISNPTENDYTRVLPATINGVAVTEAQSDDFHPDALTQTSLGTAVSPQQLTIRGMDWVSVNNSTDTDWAGSTAAGTDGSVRLATESIAELARYCNANTQASLWSNAAASATDDYLAQFVAKIDATLAPASWAYLEHANELWNPLFSQFNLVIQAACRLSATYAGATARFPGTNSITSCVRDGAGTATAVITGAPNGTTGSMIFVAGITSITGGYVALTNVVNNGDGTYSISWAESGGAVTGTVINGSSTYTSYIHTNVQPGAAHFIVKGLTTFGQQPANNYVTPLVMGGRYAVERLRVMWTAAQALPGKARFRFLLNNAVGSGTGHGLSENEAYPYAFERFGDHSWIYSIATAPYFGSDTATKAATSTDGVFAALQSTGGSSLDSFSALLVKEGTASASWGHPKVFYEWGPATTTMGTAGAFIGAAHRDPRMGTMVTTMASYMRDLAGQTGPSCFYQGGSSGAFGAADNSCWAMHENGQITDMTTPKAAALKAWLSATSVAQPVDGLTSGTISIPAIWNISTGSGTQNGCIIAGPTVVLPDLGARVVKSASGNYAISIRVCSSNTADYVSIFINGVEVAHQIPLTAQNPQSGTPATDVWSSASYPMNAGANIVLIRVKSSGRAGFVGYNQIVSPDIPV